MQQVTRKQLGAGVNLTCITTPKFKRAVLRAILLLPLGREDAACRACLPQVLRRGSAGKPSLRIIGETLDMLYGARIEAVVRKEGETLGIGFLADCIDEAYAPEAGGLTESVIRLLAELLCDPCLQNGVFRAADTAGERSNLLDRIAAQKNDPRAWAPRRLIELMCADEIYGLPALGTEEQARQITESALTDAYRRAMKSAHIELFYCGTRPAEDIAAMFADTPLGLPRENALPLPPTAVLSCPRGEARTFIEEEPVSQGKLSLGFRTGGASLSGGDQTAYRMFQTVFGGSTSSRLFLNVRERKSLCYYASAQFLAAKGILQVNSGIENRDFETARDEILRQLSLCRQGDFTEQELDGARKTLANAFRAMLDDPLALERYWLTQAAAGTFVSPEERIALLDGVTRERVTAAAQQTSLDTIFFMKGAAK